VRGWGAFPYFFADGDRPTKEYLMTEVSTHPLITSRFLDDMRELIQNSGNNQNEQVQNLITACIEEGIDEFLPILGVASKVGLKTDHVFNVLDTGTGNHPERHIWRLNADGRYAIH
jgi:hypothetical protein